MRVRLITPDAMVIISGFSWVEESPEYEVDISTLDPNIAEQVRSQCRRGVLQFDDPTFLISKTVVPQPVAPVPVPRPPQEDPDTICRRILASSVPTIQKQATKMPIAAVKALREMESQTKKRKKLLAFFETLLTQHAEAVAKVVAGKDLAEECVQPEVEGVGSELVSDIIDSDAKVVEVPIEPKQEN